MTEGTILIVAAHPDDEVLGCGGTISKFSDEVGIHVGFLTPGGNFALNEVRDQITSVRSVLGYHEDVFIGFDGSVDNKLDTGPLLDVVQVVEGMIERVGPSIILTHSISELNIDHQIAHRAVVTATRPPCCGVKLVLAFGVPEANMFDFDNQFRPNLFISLTGNDVDRKVKALEGAYASKVRPHPYPRNRESIMDIAKYYGYHAGVEYAEAFELIRGVV